MASVIAWGALPVFQQRARRQNDRHPTRECGIHRAQLRLQLIAAAFAGTNVRSLLFKAGTDYERPIPLPLGFVLAWTRVGLNRGVLRCMEFSVTA